MRLAALYSGGKDSAFALYLVKQMGHDIPYLVNIVPTDKASWIFHTPNLNIVPLMAEAMKIPLVCISSDGTEEGDLSSLKDVLRNLDIDGVVTGAVWSDYQWDRMNLVCGDLDLKVISPLWRKDQDIVYDEMVNSGIDAIIVGVFAEGLDEKWLGRHLDAECKKELIELREKFGISIIGEGGEYESMTLDSPAYEKKLELIDSNVESEKSSATLTVTKAVLKDKI
ncbi:MAG: diphthine--ammonia ligase [Candidatus Methanomethylophilaceae archaeon]|jgi:ABC transporter with metal-binding/Fe-S-binding domain ATP-binding protein